MNHADIALLILGMALVTYIPRALPAVVVNSLHLSARTEAFLRLIPYTALTALTFPGIVLVDPARMDIGIIGGLAAGLIGWRCGSVILCVVAAIGADLLLYSFF